MITFSRSLDEAREAFKNNDKEKQLTLHKKFSQVSLLENEIQSQSYDKNYISHSEHHASDGQYIKSIIYGGLDGMVTSFSIIASMFGADMSATSTIALALASILCDGISMGSGDYLGSKSEKDYQKIERQREEWEVKINPEGEKLEMIQIYQELGMQKNDAETMVQVLSKYQSVWVDIMMIEELHLIVNPLSPLKSGVITFMSFVFFGCLPLIPYVISIMLSVQMQQTLFYISSTIAIVFLFILGMTRSKFSYSHWLRCGIDTLAIGLFASFASYIIGYAFEKTILEDYQNTKIQY